MLIEGKSDSGEQGEEQTEEQDDEKE